MIRIGRKAGITGATVLIVAMGSGVAAAAVISRGPVDNSGVSHGCWSNHAIKGSRVFVMQDAGTSCPGGTTPISWNAQGPQGPAGATGPAGPSTLGSAGLDVTIVQAATNGVGTAVAYCPADHPYAISGGGSVYNTPVNLVGTPAPMAASFPVSTDAGDPGGWAVVAVYTAAEPWPEGQVSSVTAYADSAK